MDKKRVPLGDYVTEYSVRNKSDEDIPVYSVTNSQGFCTEYFDKEVASKDKTTYKIVPRGYFAYNPSRINVGSVDWQRSEERVIVSPLYNVFSVSENLDQQYLYYFLRSDIGKQMIKAKASGSVRDNLKMDMLKEMTIPERDIEEQRKCVETLDELKTIISLREKVLEKLDELIKARFVELFGNGKHDLVKASDVCDFITKGTTPATGEITDTYEEGKIPFLKVYNLSFTGEMLFDENPQFIPKETHDGKLARSKVYPNDVLMNIVGPPLGKFTLVTDEFSEWNINQAIAIFRAKERILPRFLLHALMQPKVLQPFIEQAVGIRQQNLSLEQCRNLEFPLPSIDEQQSFVVFAEQLDKSKVVAQQMLDEAQKLFDSLMQEYFG